MDLVSSEAAEIEAIEKQMNKVLVFCFKEVNAKLVKTMVRVWKKTVPSPLAAAVSLNE